MSYVKIGVAGPVGSGKTALIEALSRKMANDYSIGVITNDIYTKEDAQFLAKNSVLPVERIIGVETGGCPHTAIREDASMNLEAVDEMMERFPDIELDVYKRQQARTNDTTVPATQNRYFSRIYSFRSIGSVNRNGSPLSASSQESVPISRTIIRNGK